MISETKIEMISVFEWSGSTIQIFRKPERSDVDEALRKLFWQLSSNNMPVKDPLLMMALVLTEF
jgi:hypothetical protein